MAQISFRLSDELAESVKSEARTRGLSLNGFLTLLAETAVDPELAGSEADRIRERFRRAGLLEEWPAPSGARPDPDEVRRAKNRAGKGTPLSDLVIEDRI